MQRRPRRLLAGGIALACGASVLAGAPSRAASPAGEGDPEIGPLVSGTGAYASGTYVWTDYAYDDRGPNTNGISGGDAAYPPNPYPGNTADLIQVQLSQAPDGALRAAVVLETLVPDADAVVGIGFDTDADDLTGAAAVPGGQWPVGRPLGLEHLLLLSTADAAATLLTWDGGELAQAGRFTMVVDRERNVLEVVAAGLRPDGATWEAVALAGMADGAGSWVDGAHPVQDLAFVRAEDPPGDPVVAATYSVPQVRSAWQDNVQSDVLAGAQSASQAVAAVLFGTDRTEQPPVGPGPHTFLYHSRLDLGEGVVQSPLQYAGPYQPYGVLVPSGLGAAPPAVMYLHGANQNHLPNFSHFTPGGAVIAAPYDVPAVVLFPLGRDPNWATGPAEMDMLEVLGDATTRLGLDRDRIVLSGISAGGAGTFRHASRYPDLWTGAYAVVGGGSDQLENLTNLPFRAHNGTLDPLVNAAVWQTSTDALAAAGTVDFRSALVNTQSHVPVKVGNCWYLDLLSRRRVTDPARVRYTVDPAEFAIDEEAGIDLRPDRAYWVSGLVSRDEEPASVDVVSLARSDRERRASDTDVVEQNVTESRDLCGPRPGMRTGDNWRLVGRALATAGRQPTTNAMTVTLTNLARAVLDVGRMSISTAEPVTAQVTGDGPAQLVLAGAWPDGVIVLRDGEPVPATQGDGEVVIDADLAGAHTYRILPPAGNG